MNEENMKKKCHGHCHCEGSKADGRIGSEDNTALEEVIVEAHGSDEDDDKGASIACDKDGQEESQAALDAAIKERDDFKDKYLRALAEIENSRKRLMREKVDAQGFAVQNVIIDLLQPFDQMELALQHADKAAGEVKAWALGFQMILDHFRQVFSSHGVTSFSSVGALFDPHLHEAIETEECSDKPEGLIVFEFQKGYRMGGKTIRPAKVKVATHPKNDEVHNQHIQESDEALSQGE
jgi:molecular chaperone GrpE